MLTPVVEVPERGRARERPGEPGPPPRSRADRVALAALVACTALPALVAAIRAVREGWVPVSDQGTIGIRAADVLTARSPRLGQLSGLSSEAGQPVRSLGPMAYWPFAVTSRVGPLWGSAVVAAALAGSAMVASVRLAARRGGLGLAVPVALGLVLSARAVNPANLASTWNPAVGVWPFVLLVLLAWSIGAGEVGLLPIAVVVASLCIQAHTALALPSVVALAIGAVSAVGPAIVRRLRAERGRRWVRWWSGPTGRAAIGAAAAGAVCWALPLLEQATSRRGNMSRLTGAGGEEGAGAEMVRRVLGGALGGVPAFLRPDRLPGEEALEQLMRTEGATETAGALVVLIGLALVTARLARRRDAGALGPGLVLALLAAAAATVWLTPVDQFLVLTYTTWWIVPLGMLAWVVLGWRIGTGLGLGRAASEIGTRARAGAVAAACVVMVLVALLSPGRPEPEEPIYAAARRAGDVVVRGAGSGRVLITALGEDPSELVASTAYRLRRAGARPVVSGNDGIGAGARYAPKGRRCELIVTMGGSRNDVPPGSTVEVEVEVPSRSGATGVVWVAIGPDRGAPSC